MAYSQMTAAQFAALADKQVGKPYVLGAEASLSNDNPPKFDCSELVEWLFGRNGTPIGDLAASQYDRCKPVTGTPKPGDLVFLKNNRARWNHVGHVAVLTKKLSNGDWRVIEARGHLYGVVRSTLSYWKKRSYYAGLRRFPGFSLKTAVAAIPKNAPFRFASYNAQYPAWGGDGNYKKDGQFIQGELKPSVFSLFETNEKGRNIVRSVLGSSRFITWPTGLVSVMWDKTKWEDGAHSELSFGTIANRAMKVNLKHRANHQSFVAAAVHIRANDAFPQSWSDEKKLEEKLDDVRRTVAWLKNDTNVAVGGDWNTEHARDILEKAGFKLATPWRDTLDKEGVQRLDAVYVKGSGMEIRNLNKPGEEPGSIHNAGPSSDHHAVVANLTRLASKPTN